MSLPGPSWCPQPGRHLPRCLFSQEANSQTHISKNATEKPTARATAGSRSGMDGYELQDHLSQQRLRPTGGYFENFYSSVGSISEEIDFQQAVYLSYSLTRICGLLQELPTPIDASKLCNGQISPHLLSRMQKAHAAIGAMSREGRLKAD